MRAKRKTVVRLCRMRVRRTLRQRTLRLRLRL